MADEPTNNAEQNQDPQQSEPNGAKREFEPITTQEEFDRIIGDRVARERNKFSDYDDLKAKAEQFDQLEDQNKSEVQRAQDQAAQAEDRAARAESDALRFRVQARHGISDEDADLFLTGTDEDTLNKQAERLAQRAEAESQPRAPRPNAAQNGGEETVQGDWLRQQLARTT